MGLVGDVWNILTSGHDMAMQEREIDRQDYWNQQTLDMQKAVNAQNQANWNKEFNYQQKLNNLTMQREDSAYQRAVADAEKAGLSKWAVAGDGASATSMSTASGGQSVGQGAKVSSTISQTSFGAQLAQMRASIAQSYAVKKESEVREKQADAEMQHLKNQDALDKSRNAMDWLFGQRDLHLRGESLALEKEKQREVVHNNLNIINETIRHNKAVEQETTRSNVAKETETNRSNRRAEQQKSQELDIKRVEVLCREAETKLTASWYTAQQELMKWNKQYQEQVIALEKAGLKQKYAQMVLSGVVDLAKTAFIGYGATHGVVPVIKSSGQYQENSGVGFHAN